MKQKKILLALVLAFVLLLGGAYVLYQQMAAEAAPEQVAAPPASMEQPAQQPVQKKPPADLPHPSEAVSRPQPVKAPDFTVYDEEGNEIHLYDFLGKPIVLNFWASWCGPCQMEMPAFHDAYLEYGDEIHFVMVNATAGYRESEEKALAFLEDNDYTFPRLLDTTGEASAIYGAARSLPLTFFIDAEGYALSYASGAISEELLTEQIDLLLQ